MVREKKCEDEIGEHNAALERYPNKSYDREERRPKGGTTNEKSHRKNTTGIISLHVILFSAHSFSQAKVLNFDIYDGDMPGDLEDYYDEEKEYVDEEDLYFPGDSGKSRRNRVTISRRLQRWNLSLRIPILYPWMQRETIW